MIPLWVKALIVAAILAVTFGAGWKTNGWRLDSKYQAEKVAQDEVNKKAFGVLIADRDVKAAQLTAANDASLKKLGASQHETTRLRNLANAGTVGLYINAVCPTPGPNPQAPSNPGVDTGTGAELDPTARLAYNALREGINTVEGKLVACQGELRLRQ